MLDDRVRAVLAGLPDDELGRFLFAVTAPQTDCEVLELGARSTLWLAAGVRYFGGRVLALDERPESMQQHLDAAGLGGWALVTNRHVRDVDDVFDVVICHEEPDDETWALVRERVEPGALVVGGRDDAQLETTTIAGIRLGVVLR
jgi:predicted O-methyltransferase YrrM